MNEILSILSENCEKRKTESGNAIVALIFYYKSI